MINAYASGDFISFHGFFDQAIAEINYLSTKDELSLKIIYLYASYLETFGETLSAGAYYSYVKEHSVEKSVLRSLSEIGYSSIFASDEATISALQKSINFANSSPNITADEKISLIVRSSYLDHNLIKAKLFENNFDVYVRNSSQKLFFLFLSLIELNLDQSFSSSTQEIRNLLMGNNDYLPGMDQGLWNAVLAQRASDDGDYESALSFAKLSLEKKIGPFESNGQLTDTIKKLKSIPFSYIFSYARHSLFQTRLGKGLAPVIDALQIYETGYDRQLILKLQSVNAIASERKNSNLLEPHTPLIVGTYLYQNTNDLSYLSRSISVLDGFSSGGSQYWTLARKKMRTDKRFTAAIVKERALAEGMKYLEPGTTLAEIRQKQLAFEAHRDQMSEDFSEFYEELTTGYKVELQEVQNDLAVDTTGLVAFYQNEAILYRLFIAPDTIDIAVMNDSRAEIMELTTELAETIPAGKSAAHTKKASRRLYQLLFTGLDSLLPERMHVVTTGELENVPFAALRRDAADGAPRYLGLECAISRQSSIREMQLLEDLELAPKYAEPLGMAPDFSNEFLQASELRQAGFKLPPLVFNTEEVRDLQGRSVGQYYYDASATINHYVQAAPDYSIIHLATHAISSQTDGLRSHLYLLDDGGEPVQLYASDIGDQTLNANLVVLSACETGGGGRHVNEGKVGLTKAYLAAGARSVVSSNWAVDDHATAELMGTFYEQLERGRSPHDALQYSRRAYLERHPDAAPYKWAAFEAYGGMKPVNWKQYNSMWPAIGYGGAVAFFAVLLGSFFQRRGVHE
jgi:CHAT domain-containing protein